MPRPDSVPAERLNRVVPKGECVTPWSCAIREKPALRRGTVVNVKPFPVLTFTTAAASHHAKKELLSIS